MIFQEYNRGATIEEVRILVKPYGYKQHGSSAIQRIISNPLYAGLIRVPAHTGSSEKLIKGRHTPIISEGEYWTAQDKLTGGKRLGMNSNLETPLKGVLRCHC